MRQSLEAHLNPVKADSFLAQATGTINAQSEKVQAALSEVLRAAQDSITKEAQKIEEGRSTLDRRMDPTNTTGYLSAIIQKMDQFDSSLTSQFNETDTASFVGKLKQMVDDHFGSDGKTLQLWH